MIENNYPVSATLEPLQAGGAEASWLGRDLSAEPFELRGKRILLVEDQEPVRAALRMMLELDGHQVTEARNGAEALNVFTVGNFDLVITDFEMPLLAGNKLAVGIKLLAPSQPILMITASAGACRGFENPVDALLSKPLTVTELRWALGRLLSASCEVAGPNVVPPPETPSATFAPEPQIVAGLPE